MNPTNQFRWALLPLQDIGDSHQTACQYCGNNYVKELQQLWISDYIDEPDEWRPIPLVTESLSDLHETTNKQRKIHSSQT